MWRRGSSPSRYIVITSREEDVHVPLVEQHLDEPFTLLDWTDIPAKKTASYRLTGQGMELSWQGRSLHKAASIWYRKPFLMSKMLNRLPAKSKEMAGYAATTLTDFNNLLVAHFDKAFWVSDYGALVRASRKNLQLELAQRLGFKVPETLITSSSRAARSFVAHHNPVIVKPVEAPLFIFEGKEFTHLARIVDRHTIDYSGLHLAPAIFQQAVDVAVDLRVTVVGKRVFAIMVTGNAIDERAHGVRDWRIVHHTGSMVIEPFDLPRRIANLCVEHVRESGLQFGAIDLVLDKKGSYWFLENNPNGQWAFVEMATKQPIGKAIADSLMRGARENR